MNSKITCTLANLKRHCLTCIKLSCHNSFLNDSIPLPVNLFTKPNKTLLLSCDFFPLLVAAEFKTDQFFH